MNNNNLETSHWTKLRGGRTCQEATYEIWRGSNKIWLKENSWSKERWRNNEYCIKVQWAQQLQQNLVWFNIKGMQTDLQKSKVDQQSWQASMKLQSLKIEDFIIELVCWVGDCQAVIVTKLGIICWNSNTNGLQKTWSWLGNFSDCNEALKIDWKCEFSSSWIEGLSMRKFYIVWYCEYTLLTKV